VKGKTDPRLPVAMETALYRIVQEALTNAVKHAQATAITIELQHAPGKIVCSVSDDGRGFEAGAETVKHGLGLLGIRERLNAFSGSLQVFSNARYGTALVAEIPLGDAYALPCAAGG
jgi:signal transduction histidine kinase